MHHYHLEIKLIDNSILKGKAITTAISDKVEYLVIEASGESQNIQLDQIHSITAIKDSAVFKTVVLT